MHPPTDRITHTTAFVTQVVEHWLELEIRVIQTVTEHHQHAAAHWPVYRDRGKLTDYIVTQNVVQFN